nr:MAG TPA: hypothetical protein [Caudoviricetes sp.]
MRQVYPWARMMSSSFVCLIAKTFTVFDVASRRVTLQHPRGSWSSKSARSSLSLRTHHAPPSMTR